MIVDCVMDTGDWSGQAEVDTGTLTSGHSILILNVTIRQENVRVQALDEASWVV